MFWFSRQRQLNPGKMSLSRDRNFLLLRLYFSVNVFSSKLNPITFVTITIIIVIIHNFIITTITITISIILTEKKVFWGFADTKVVNHVLLCPNTSSISDFSFPSYLGNRWYFLWLESSPLLFKTLLEILEINNKNFQKETFSKGMLRESAVYRMIKRHMFRINFCQKTSAIDSYHLHHHCFHDHNRITKWIKAIECVTLWDGRHSNMALQHLQLHQQVYCLEEMMVWGPNWGKFQV